MTNKIRNIDSIKDKINIHEVLDYLGIDTMGENKICCPLHEEKTPSFSIYNEGRNWTCFGECSTGGGGIRLLELYKNISYYDAVQEIGNLVGVQPEFSNMSELELKEIQSRSKIERILEELNTYFKGSFWLMSIDSDKAKEYLFDERLISKELVHLYEIGYAPWDYTDMLIDLVDNSDITFEELIEYRLLGSKDVDNPTRTNVYCTLRNCITIPVIERGRVVGFIGRNIDESASYKYMKVGYTDYWDGIVWQDGDSVDGYLKGDVLHIVEGQIDALTLKQCGIDNVWAINGVNSLTWRVVDLIKKMNPNRVYVHLDWDSTGEKAETQWAEKLGYKCYIMPPVDVQADNEGKEIKDVNRLFTFLYKQGKSNGNDDDIAFKNAVRIVRRNLEKRIKQAKNLITLEFEKWRDIGKDDLESVKDDIKNIQELIKDKKREIKDIEKKIRDGEALDDELEELEEDLNTLEEEFLEVDEKLKDMVSEVNKLKGSELQSLLQLAYSQYEGNAQLLELFKKDLMIQGVTSKVYESMMKDIIKGSALIPAQRGQVLEMPEWEVIDGVLCKNVFDIRDGEIKPIVISKTPPTISKVLVNVDTNLSELEISYISKRGIFRKEVLSDISTRKGILDALRGKDFDASESNIVDIMNYLNHIDLELGEEAEIEQITERFGWHNDYKTFVIGNDVLGEPVVSFKGAGEGEDQVAEAYVIKGTLEAWKRLIPLTKGRHLMRFQLYSSFGTPLIPIVESGNFVQSNWENSSKGKTTSNKVAGSIWGNVNEKSGIPSTLVEGNRISLDKLEKGIYLRKDIPVFLQESNRAKYGVMENMIYMLEGGQGAGRGGVGRGSQKTRELRTLLFCTSETPLVNDGAANNTGELARALEFHGSPIGGKNNKLVKQIENIMYNNYGIVGRMFIQNLIDRNGNFKDIKDRYDEVSEGLVDETQSNILNRIIPKLAVVILGGILANEILDLGLTEEEIVNDVMSCIDVIKEDIDDAPYHVTALETVADFFISHKNMFYYQGYADPSSDIEQEKAIREVYGNERYGVWRDDDGYIGVIKTKLDKYLKQEEVDPNRCYRGWKEDEYIDTDKKGYTKQVYDPQLKSNVRMIKFKLDKLTDYIGETIKPVYPVPRNLRVVTSKDIVEVFEKAE